MDARREAMAKMLERCPWCGGRVTIIRASEPGELTVIACMGEISMPSPCAWSITGQEADGALEAAVAMKQSA